MNISFENKVALVTGAASGLGLATGFGMSLLAAAVAQRRRLKLMMFMTSPNNVVFRQGAALDQTCDGAAKVQ